MSENNEIPSKNEEEGKSYERLNNMFGHLFSRELWDAALHNQELFDDLFADRRSEIDTFRRVCSPLLGDSVVFVGRMGEGKSALFRRLIDTIESGELFGSTNRTVHWIFLDLDRENPPAAIDLIKRAAECFRDYLDRIKCPRSDELNTVDKLSSTKAVYLVSQALTDHLEKHGEEAPYLFFFVDDLDYAPDVWYDLVLGLGAILALPSISPIYAARPLLEAKMFGCRDFRIKRVMSDAHRIKLQPLPVREVITNRVKEIADRKPKSVWKSLMDKFLTPGDDLYTLLEHVGLRQSGEFKYPFVPKFERFLQKTSNGNTTLILSMVKIALEYILSNRRAFRPNGKGLYHLERPLILQLFGDYQGSPIVNLNDSNFRSFNQSSPAHTGNALLLNLLEWIHYCSGNDAMRSACFKELGHPDAEITRGLTHCEAMHLIEPRTDAPVDALENLTIHSYKLTPKGAYHLVHLMTWTEYDREFGPLKDLKRIRPRYYDDNKLLPERAMYTDVIEFLLYVATAIEEVKPDAKEMRLSLSSLIDAYVNYQTTYYRRGAQELYSPDNPDSDYMIDEPKLTRLLTDPPMDVKLGTRRINLGKYVSHKSKKPHPSWVRLSIRNIKDAAKSLSFETLSKIPTKQRCYYEYFQKMISDALVGFE